MITIDQIKKKVNRYLDGIALEELEDKVRLVKDERLQLKGWSDKELKLAAEAFRDDLKKGTGLDEMLIPAFAVASEAARRLYNQTPYDVQILAGVVIHQGKIVEMKAGEGKTLTETMPVYLNALEGKGVHIITTNDYLAKRDAEWMGKLYNFLGLSVGYVTSDMENDDRRKAYAADITYVTNQEIGFDYLRDNLVYKRADRVLRKENPLHFGIVDEIDSILIDESRTPLIIAEPVKEEMQFYDLFTKIVNKLKEDEDYKVDYKDKFVSMTDEGLNKCAKQLGEPVFSKENPMYVFYLDVCLRARVLFEKDRDYIVAEDGVEIVDEFTGRVLPGRRFTDGVHQAIEAKEKVEVKEADRTLAAITFQNFFPMYEKLSGMSGTVMGARDEFAKVYKMEVLEVPTNRPVMRVDHNDLFFKTKKGKFLGMIKKIRHASQKGQPVLIGARTVEIAHEVSKILNDQNMPHQLLTAADHKAEAEKIKQAGQEGMITVATNMAGRGTDILLGPGVPELGGLYVLGTERHESRRIDDQLIGRSGRQGEPGESQFLISMEDEIMQLFGSEKIINTMEELDIPEDEYISGQSLDNAFKKAQDFVDSKNLDSRIYLYKYDSVINFQRRVVSEIRESLLENKEGAEAFLRESVALVAEEVFALKNSELVARQLKNIFGLEITPGEIEEVMRHKGHSFGEVLAKTVSYLQQQAENLKKSKEAYAASQNLVLEILDNQWSQHLELMDLLKQEAGLFSYATEDPIVDFVLESKKMFAHMESETRQQAVKSVFLYLSQAGLIQ